MEHFAGIPARSRCTRNIYSVSDPLSRNKDQVDIKGVMPAFDTAQKVALGVSGRVLEAFLIPDSVPIFVEDGGFGDDLRGRFCLSKDGLA